MDRNNFEKVVSSILLSARQNIHPIRLTLDVLDSTAIIVHSGDNIAQ